MKNLFKLSLGFSVALVVFVMLFSMPKVSTATDVIACCFHNEKVDCQDENHTIVNRCKYDGITCNVSAQELCPEDR